MERPKGQLINRDAVNPRGRGNADDQDWDLAVEEAGGGFGKRR